MRNKPTFTVIIPTYNRSSQLIRALDSLVLQTYTNMEVIVVDDGSTDNTSEIVEPYQSVLDLRYLWNENWGGPARPRNIGLKHAAGEWICFLDSDDSWHPEKLNTCLPFLDESDILYHNFDVTGDSGIENRKYVFCRNIPRDDAFMDLLLNWNAIVTSGVVVRKEIMDKVGLFTEDPSLIGIEDYDMWLRIAQVTNRFTFIPEMLGDYHLSGVSLTRNLERCMDLDLSLLKKYKDSLTVKQYRRLTTKIHYNSGLRHLCNGDIRVARSYFMYVLFHPSDLFTKFKSAGSILFGKHSFVPFNLLSRTLLLFTSGDKRR